MTAVQILVAALVRAVVYAVLFLVVDATFVRSDLSTDALALGLLLIAGAFVVSFGWALVDGARRGFVVALVLWLVASVLIGLAIGVLSSYDVVVDPDTTDLAAGWIAGTLATLPSALVGVAIGGLVHRARGGRDHP